MFRRILVPLDGSENSERVLPWVKRYAGRDRAQAVLLQVVPREYPMKGLPFASESGEPKEYLGRIERDLNYAGIPVRMLLRSGDVARTIVAVAEQEVCDLVAISSRGASKIARWLMGGITQQVVRRSQVPLLIVRARPAPGRDRHPRRILVPLDGSDVAESILPWSAQLARFHRAQALLLHVRHRTPGRILHPRQSSGDYSARLSRLCDRLGRQGIRAAAKILEGDAAHQIISCCGPADALAATTHGFGGIKHLVFGSVAEKLFYEAPVPTFIYKSRRNP